MDKLLQFMEEKLTPIAVKLDRNVYLSAIRSGFMGSMPLLIVGSFFVLFGNLPIPGYADFMEGILGENWGKVFSVPNDVSMSMMTVYVIIAMANELSNKYKLNRIACILAALVAFFVVTPMHPFADDKLGVGIPLSNLGAAGLFVGMILTVLAVEILRFTDKRGWKIKMPDTVPQNISASFSALIPIALVVIVFNFVRIGFEFTSYNNLQSFIFSNLQKPLTALGATLPATIIVMLLEGTLWSFGIHGANVVGSVMQPIWLTLTAENGAAVAAGEVIPNIVNYQFYSNFIKVGGSGATFGLCLLLLFFSRSEHFKSLGKLAIGPEIFNINEPQTFGIPIVLNPVMIIPFIIAPIAMTLVAYFSMKTGLVPLTNGVNIPWTTPPIISGLLICGWRGAVLQIVQMLLSVAIYFPFFRIADDMAVNAEVVTTETPEGEEAVA